jgi:hypothetical protein
MRLRRELELTARVRLVGAMSLLSVLLMAAAADAAPVIFNSAPAALDGKSVNGMSNNGVIVGAFGTLARYDGYIYDNGTLTTVTFPGLPSGSSSQLISINSGGIATGDYFNASSEETHGFIYNRNNNTFLTPVHSGAVFQAFNAINDQGLVAAPYYDSNFIAHSAIYNLETQTWTDLPDHGAFGTAVQAVHPNGDAIVNYLDSAGNLHGAVYRNGAYVDYDYPNAKSTSLSMINSSGVIIGTWIDNSNAIHGLILNEGLFYSVDVPDARATILTHGFNDANQLVGYFAGAVPGSGFKALSASVVLPEPTCLALTFLGVGGLLLRRPRRD